MKNKELGVLPDEVILSELNHPNSLQQRVLELNEDFDFMDFLRGETDVETAIGIITFKQCFFLECQLADTDSHAYNFQALYDSIYNSSVNIITRLGDKRTWQDLVVADNNIVVQLTKFGDLYIWCPEKINEFQLDALHQINKQLKELQDMNSDYFQHLFLDFHAWIRKEHGEVVSIELSGCSLEELLAYYEENYLCENHISVKK